MLRYYVSQYKPRTLEYYKTYETLDINKEIRLNSVYDMKIYFEFIERCIWIIYNVSKV